MSAAAPDAKSPDDPAPRTIGLPGHGGLRLVADSYGDPKAHPVVLLHGGGQTRHSWDGTAIALARAGWHAIAVDMRGHGESDWHPDGAYAFLDFAADVLEMLPSFDRPPVLVGASLGGIAALFAVGSEEHPRCAGLVLVDIAPQIEPDGAQRIIDFMRARPHGFASLEEAADAVQAYNPHRPRPKDLSGLAKNLRRKEDGRYYWHWDPNFLNPNRRGPERDERLAAAARNLTVPTLLVRGKLSDLLSEEGARAFLELAPHARFADVSGAGHMVAGDRNDAFARVILDFLATDVKRLDAPTAGASPGADRAPGSTGSGAD